MYAVCVACSASSAVMAVTFASSYSHPHLLPPVLTVPVAVVPFPAEPVVAVVVAVVGVPAALEAEPGALREAGDESDAETELPADAVEALSLLSRHRAV